MQNKLKKIFTAVAALLIILTVVLFLLKKNKKPEWAGTKFHTYSAYEETLQTDVTLYLGYKNNKIYAVLAGYIKEIDLNCSLCFIHECTPEMFENAKDKIEKEYAQNFLGETETPDLKNYPDLSHYIPLILSADDRHEIWKQFGIEE